MSRSIGYKDFGLGDPFLKSISEMTWFNKQVNKETIINQVTEFLREFCQSRDLERFVKRFQDSDWFPALLPRDQATLDKRIWEFLKDYQERFDLTQRYQTPPDKNQPQPSFSPQVLVDKIFVDEMEERLEKDEKFKALSLDQKEAIRRKVPDFANRDWVLKFDEDQRRDTVWVLLQHEMLKLGLAHPEGVGIFSFSRKREGA